MTRDEWRQRMLDADIPEEVVNATLEGMSDEDFARMKDLSPDQLLKDLQEAELLQNKDGDGEDDDVLDITDAFDKFQEDVMAKIDAALAGLKDQEVEIELPSLDAITEKLDAVVAAVEALKDDMAALREDDEQRLLALAKDMSRNSKARLLVHQRSSVLSDEEVDRMVAVIQKRLKSSKSQSNGQPQPGGIPGGADFAPVVRDALGNEYESVGEMMNAASRSS